MSTVYIKPRPKLDYYLDYYPVYAYKAHKHSWLDGIRNKRHGKPKTKKSKKIRH